MPLTIKEVEHIANLARLELTDEEKALINNGLNFYVIDLSNVGGLVMPVILQLEYADQKINDLRGKIEKIGSVSSDAT